MRVCKILENISVFLPDNFQLRICLYNYISLILGALPVGVPPPNSLRPGLGRDPEPTATRYKIFLN